MTTIARTAAVPGRPDLVRRRVVGTPTEVAATVAVLANTGRLVSATTPRQLDPHNPTVTVIVTAQLRPTTAARPRASARPRWVKPTVIAAASLAAVAGAGYALMLATRAVVHQAVTHWPTIVAVVVLVALVLIALARKACPGLHCSGCSKH